MKQRGDDGADGAAAFAGCLDCRSSDHCFLREATPPPPPTVTTLLPPSVSNSFDHRFSELFVFWNQGAHLHELDLLATRPYSCVQPNIICGFRERTLHEVIHSIIWKKCHCHHPDETFHYLSTPTKLLSRPKQSFSK
ncbi:uncharacterized protein [Zea mays]|nr:uncharacterized protein LOC103639728 isoform X2 [Zea mays]|eukprot:XP_020402084.1 uncharacterized protein LOC103639728 isoform X2 [Zea mays]